LWRKAVVRRISGLIAIRILQLQRFQKAEPCRWFAGIPDMQLHKGRLDGEVGLSLWVLL
jgi:hypothetical protein